MLKNHKVIFKQLPCSFCYKRKCPTAHECMDEISVEDVFDAVKATMNGNANPVRSENQNKIKI